MFRHGLGTCIASKRETCVALIELFVFAKGQRGATIMQAGPHGFLLGASGEQLSTAGTPLGEVGGAVGLVLYYGVRDPSLSKGNRRAQRLERRERAVSHACQGDVLLP